MLQETFLEAEAAVRVLLSRSLGSNSARKLRPLQFWRFQSGRKSSQSFSLNTPLPRPSPAPPAGPPRLLARTRGSRPGPVAGRAPPVGRGCQACPAPRRRQHGRCLRGPPTGLTCAVAGGRPGHTARARGGPALPKLRAGGRRRRGEGSCAAPPSSRRPEPCPRPHRCTRPRPACRADLRPSFAALLSPKSSHFPRTLPSLSVAPSVAHNGPFLTSDPQFSAWTSTLYTSQSPIPQPQAKGTRRFTPSPGLCLVLT